MTDSDYSLWPSQLLVDMAKMFSPLPPVHILVVCLLCVSQAPPAHTSGPLEQVLDLWNSVGFHWFTDNQYVSFNYSYTHKKVSG